MNNREYMESLSDEELAEFLDINVDGCMTEMCALCSYGDCNASHGKGCRHGILSWLREEHTEPDSAAVISGELAKLRDMHDMHVSGGGYACIYGHSFMPFDEGDPCPTCRFDAEESCVSQFLNDLSERVAGLDAQ